jgi:hypothetical protein
MNDAACEGNLSFRACEEKRFTAAKRRRYFLIKKPQRLKRRGEDGVDGTNEVLLAEGFSPEEPILGEKHYLAVHSRYICLFASLVDVTKVQESIAPTFGDPSATSVFLCTAS